MTLLVPVRVAGPFVAYREVYCPVLFTWISPLLMTVREEAGIKIAAVGHDQSVS